MLYEVGMVQFVGTEIQWSLLATVLSPGIFKHIWIYGEFIIIARCNHAQSRGVFINSGISEFDLIKIRIKIAIQLASWYDAHKSKEQIY